MGSHILGFFGVRQFFIFMVSKKVKCSSFNLKNGSIPKNRKCVSWDPENYMFAQTMTRMGSNIGHRIDYNGVGGLRGQQHIPSKN